MPAAAFIAYAWAWASLAFVGTLWSLVVDGRSYKSASGWSCLSAPPLRATVLEDGISVHTLPLRRAGVEERYLAPGWPLLPSATTYPPHLLRHTADTCSPAYHINSHRYYLHPPPLWMGRQPCLDINPPCATCLLFTYALLLPTIYHRQRGGEQAVAALRGVELWAGGVGWEGVPRCTKRRLGACLPACAFAAAAGRRPHHARFRAPSRACCLLPQRLLPTPAHLPTAPCCARTHAVLWMGDILFGVYRTVTPAPALPLPEGGGGVLDGDGPGSGHRAQW